MPCWLLCAALALLTALALPAAAAWLLSRHDPRAFDHRVAKGYAFAFEEGYAPFRPGEGWATIPRVALRDLSFETFRREYVLKRRPVIVSGLHPKPGPGFPELVEECGHLSVEFENHYLHDMLRIPLWLHPVIDAYLSRSYGPDAGVSMSSVIHQRLRAWTVRQWHEALSTVPNMTAAPARRTWILDYIWPLSVHGQSYSQVQRECPTLKRWIKDVQRTFNGTVFDRAVASQSSAWRNPSGPTVDLYVGSRNSRAYPLHQHGFANENFLTVVSGRKRVVLFPPSQEAYLYERPEFSTEFGDRVFMAQAFNASLDLRWQPQLAFARGAEGVVKSGEMIYVPANSIHEVENEEDTVALAMHLEAGARILGPEVGGHLEELAQPGGKQSRRPMQRKPGYSSGLGWRLLRSLASRSLL